VLVAAWVLIGAAVIGMLVSERPDVTVTLGLFVLLGAVSEFAAARFASKLDVTGSEAWSVLAMVVLGTRGGALVATVACLTSWALERYRTSALVINLAGYVAPVVAAGLLFHGLVDDPASGGSGFVAVLVVAVAVATLGNLVVVLPLMAMLDGIPPRENLRAYQSLLPTLGFQALFIVTTIAVYVEIGAAALAFVLVITLAFAYMARLVLRARDRAREYANLSWGLLSGLIRTLDARDSRAARHCAAVAKFSRDIAAAVGMDEKDQELAHTAGLLHDIGRFALSDRVMDRGTQLQPGDWKAIRRHPELGAELLQDIGVYGPVADIIRAHHERIDGRGYPLGLLGGQIPEIAKIVAVAEVYDTLTAPDTYRTAMNSFEALTELRRVAGSQLDGRYVEALALLMAGQGTDYRHADDADFDAELDIQRRMNEAAIP
jgi:putative nucleotidyltransferase with HDIG domain